MNHFQLYLNYIPLLFKKAFELYIFSSKFNNQFFERNVSHLGLYYLLKTREKNLQKFLSKSEC